MPAPISDSWTQFLPDDHVRSAIAPRSGVHKRFRGVEQPRQRFAQLRPFEPGREVAFDIGDRALQHVEPVAQRVELRTCEHQLVFAEPELVGPVTSFVVTLTATLAAELARPATRSCGRQGPSAPPARCARVRRPARRSAVRATPVGRLPRILLLPRLCHSDKTVSKPATTWRDARRKRGSAHPGAAREVLDLGHTSLPAVVPTHLGMRSPHVTRHANLATVPRPAPIGNLTRNRPQTRPTAFAASSVSASWRSMMSRPPSQKPGSARSTPTIAPSSSGGRDPPAARSSR
jgi:hypothetical protein